MRLRKRILFIILSLLLLFACQVNNNIKTTATIRINQINFNNNSFSIVLVDLNHSTLSLFWQQPSGEHFRNIQRLDRWLQNRQQRLLVATNAGIFAPDFTPVGLHIEQGRVLHSVNLEDGAGNFFLKPNGIFLIDDRGASIIESSMLPNNLDKIITATQSGPLLVLNNSINKQFKPDSTNRVIRSGIGVKSAKELYLVISEQPVNFYDFALLFQEKLACANALYLDGAISKLYAPAEKRFDDGEFTGILAVIENDK
jgi:uncharacterized protein YigE (DUF2233 family)